MFDPQMSAKSALVGPCKANWALEKFDSGAPASHKVWRQQHAVKSSVKLQLLFHVRRVRFRAVKKLSSR